MAKGLTAGELRVQMDDELFHKLSEARTELFNLRFQSATGQLESHGRLRAVRKEIARIYTVMRERELGIVTVLAPGEQAAAEPAESGPAETSSAAGATAEETSSE